MVRMEESNSRKCIRRQEAPEDNNGMNVGRGALAVTCGQARDSVCDVCGELVC
jgi:hypothetical protein